MSKKKQKHATKRNLRLKGIAITVGAVLAFGLILATSGFAFAATKESSDPFCTSCHT